MLIIKYFINIFLINLCIINKGIFNINIKFYLIFHEINTYFSF